MSRQVIQRLVAVDRGYYAERTPRSCCVCLAPATDRVRRASADGKTLDKSSVRAVCDTHTVPKAASEAA